MSVESPITLSDNWFIGEDRIFEFTVVDSGGATQNITNWAISWVLRKFREAGTPLLTKTVGAGITITNGAGGVCQVAINHTDTIGAANAILIEPGRYTYALTRTDSGTDTVLAYGDAVLQISAGR